MEKLIWISFCVVFVTLLACSSSKPTVEENPELVEEMVVKDRVSPRGQRAQNFQEDYDAMIAQLNLSEEQEVKFLEINKRYADQVRVKMENSGEEDKMLVREEMRGIRDAQNVEIQTILTLEQFELYQKIRTEQRGKRRSQFGREQRPGN